MMADGLVEHTMPKVYGIGIISIREDSRVFNIPGEQVSWPEDTAIALSIRPRFIPPSCSSVYKYDAAAIVLVIHASQRYG